MESCHSNFVIGSTLVTKKLYGRLNKYTWTVVKHIFLSVHHYLSSKKLIWGVKGI